jgi:hypothetical protein
MRELHRPNVAKAKLAAEITRAVGREKNALNKDQVKSESGHIPSVQTLSSRRYPQGDEQDDRQ